MLLDEMAGGRVSLGLGSVCGAEASWSLGAGVLGRVGTCSELERTGTCSDGGVDIDCESAMIADDRREEADRGRRRADSLFRVPTDGLGSMLASEAEGGKGGGVVVGGGGGGGKGGSVGLETSVVCTMP